MSNTAESTTLSVTVVSDPEQQLPIKLDSKALAKIRKNKQKEALADARAFQLLGSKIIKIKNTALAKIGEQVEKHGVKKIGHGKLASASQNADQALAECDKYIAELLANNPNVDPKVFIQLMQVKLEFNRQVMELGEAHMAADRQASSAIQGNSLQIPFPAGQSLTISTPPAPAPPIEPKQVKG